MNIDTKFYRYKTDVLNIGNLGWNFPVVLKYHTRENPQSSLLLHEQKLVESKDILEALEIELFVIKYESLRFNAVFKCVELKNLNRLTEIHEMWKESNGYFFNILNRFDSSS